MPEEVSDDTAGQYDFLSGQPFSIFPPLDAAARGMSETQLARTNPSFDSPAAYHAGLVWPYRPAVGSWEDLLDDRRKTKAHGFVAIEGLLNGLRIAAVTPQAPDVADDEVQQMVRSLLTAHRPQFTVCVTPLRVQAGTKNDSPGQEPAWARQFSLCVAQSLEDEAGRTHACPLSEKLREACRAEDLGLLPWRHHATPAAAAPRLIAGSLPLIVRKVCNERGVPCVALGVVRYEAGEEPSRELIDYQHSASTARKFGRMLRWVVKNRSAIRETAQAAQDNLRAGDLLAKAAARLIRSARGTKEIAPAASSRKAD